MFNHRTPKPRLSTDCLDDLENQIDTAWVAQECDWFERRLNLHTEPEEPQEIVFAGKLNPSSSRKTAYFFGSKRSLVSE
jgi:hypothetical protein